MGDEEQIALLCTVLEDMQGPFLQQLADQWLAAGATTVSIWAEGRPFISWPADASFDDALISSSIEVGGIPVGELRIGGLTDSSARARLLTDALLLSRIADLEGDLEHMTSELIESHDQLLALYDLNQATRSHLDIGQTLHNLADTVVRLVKVSSAFTILRTSDWLEIAHHPTSILCERTMVTIFDEMRQAERELLFTPETAPHIVLKEVDNLYISPIWIRGSIMAGLGLVNKTGGFTSPDLKLVRAIVEQAGAQIENVLLHREALDQARMQAEMDLARRVQLSLLPNSPPCIDGIDVYAESRPALHVGGDFYDFLVQPDGGLFFALSDVTGKGMSAALMMAVTRTMLRSQATTVTNPTPEVVMRFTNDRLYDDFTDVEMFATVFLGHYDPVRRQLTYANAGHSPVLYRPAGGVTRLLEANGTAMGVLPISLCDDQILPFAVDDLLIVATDGFNETHQDEHDMFGIERLQTLVDSVANHPAELIAQVLFREVEAFGAGYPQQDDRTIVVLKGSP